MKLLVLGIIVFSLYLIYRLSFPKQAGKYREDESVQKEPPDEYDAVPKSRFVRPDLGQPQPTPSTSLKSENQAGNASIFAAGNEKTNAVILPEELGEVFAEDVNPDDLDIEPDANETDSDDQPDAGGDDEEETEEIRQGAGEIEGYAEGFTYDELATVIRDTDKPETMTKAAVKTLHDFSQTDMFEKLVSGDTDRAARIASLLDRSEQSFTGQDEDAVDDKNDEYKDFDIGEFLN